MPRFRNSAKPARSDGESWVLHGEPDWSARHAMNDPARVISLLKAELERLAGKPLPNCSFEGAHFWRYSQPVERIEEGCLFDREASLVIAGDAYSGGRVEGAFTSGQEAAARILEVVSAR